MASAYGRRGSIVPICVNNCGSEATTVVAWPNGEAKPYCPSCSNGPLLDSDGSREYPVEEFFQVGGHVSEWDPPNQPTFDLFVEGEPGRQTTEWMCANREVYRHASVDLTEMI